MCEVASDEVSCSKGREERQLTSQYCSTHDPSQLGGILSWLIVVGALHTKHLWRKR